LYDAISKTELKTIKIKHASEYFLRLYLSLSEPTKRKLITLWKYDGERGEEEEEEDLALVLR
jgi:hypothetical protein